MKRKQFWVSAIALGALTLAACVPAGPSQPGATGPAEQQAAAARKVLTARPSQRGAPGRAGQRAPAARKVLTVGTSRELLNFADFLGYGTSGGGNRAVRYIAQDYLIAQAEERHPPHQ